jgi:hypothetical protein
MHATNESQRMQTAYRTQKSRKRPSRPSDHPANAISPPTKTIAAVSSERRPASHQRQPQMWREFKLICPVHARLRQSADRPVPQLRPPILGRQLVKERFARLVVAAVHLDP